MEEILTSVGSSIANMSSAKFSVVDEMETGAPFFGTKFRKMEAEVESNGSVRMLVDVEAPGFGFVEIEIIKVGDQAFLKLSKDASWDRMPPSLVPFEFVGLIEVFSTLPDTIQDAALTGREELQGAQTLRIEGGIDSGDLLPLINSTNPGHPVNLTLWIEEAGLLLRQIRLVGRLYDDDGPETSRLLEIRDINVPVDIQLPDSVSGQ